ncbi:MAG TPA: hypothetical protein VJ780_03220 [Flavobacterium sp.]|nr:hypothetical protein [Flavobacterium sp.]
MKIYFLILIILLFLGCKKIFEYNYLVFLPVEAIKIKELTNFNEPYICTGSYQIKKDTVISIFKVQSKYSLAVIKLKNVSPKFHLNYYSNTDFITPGWFSTVSTEVQNLDFLPSLFDDESVINNISLTSDKEIKCYINNDSIKCFSMDLNKYEIKINNNVEKVINGKLDYYGFPHISSNILFYKIKDEIYIFIMTPSKKDVIVEEDTLYNFLFPKY